MSKTSKLVELYQQGHTQNTAGTELKNQGIKTSRSFRYAIWNRYQKGEFSGEQREGKVPPPGGKPSLTIKTAGTKTPEEKLRIIQPGKEGELPTTIRPDMALTPEDIGYMFELANQAIPEKRRPTEKATIILGKLWYQPLNKALEQYADKNPLLYAAVLATAGVYTLVIIGVVQDWRKEKSKKKKLEKTEQEKLESKTK